jgi:hypothetical protein
MALLCWLLLLLLLLLLARPSMSLGSPIARFGCNEAHESAGGLR